MAGISKTLASSLVLVFALFFSSFCEAKNILVGGRADAWNVPSSQSDTLNQWAQNTRFQIGDSIVWKYDAAKDSVLQVTKEAYLNCNTTSPIAEYKDGNSSVKLNKSGPFFFISGVEGNCAKGQKVIIVVMSPKSKYRYTGISPAPAPMEFEGTAVAPASSATSFKASLVVVALGVLIGFGVVLN